MASRPCDSESTASIPAVGRRALRVPDLDTGTIDAVLAAFEPTDRSTSFEGEPTARIPLISAEEVPAPLVQTTQPRPCTPGKRRAVKHAGRRGPLFRGLPSPPVLLGVAALAVSVVGAVSAHDIDPASSGSRGGNAQASALNGTGGLGTFRSTAPVSRDSDRQSLGAAATPPITAEVNERNAALAKLAKSAQSQADKIALNLWIAPLDPVVLTARFGEYGLWSSYHTGLDFNGETGDQIHAIANGVVTFAGYDGSYGNKTVVTLDDGTELWYCHQSAQYVSVGDTVRQDEIIGAVGATGHVTGSHLHIEVRPGGGDPVDPYPAFVLHGVDLPQ